MILWLIRFVFLLFCILWLGSCTVGPNFHRPPSIAPKSYTIESLKKHTVTTKTQFGEAQYFNPKKDIPREWWELFHSKAINSLVIAGLKHNPDVANAKALLHSALEEVYAQRGAFYPFIGASFSPTKQQTAGILTSVLNTNRYNYSLYTGQVFVSYTPDVFGANRRLVESLLAGAEFERFQLEATYLTIASNVVNAAIQEAALRRQISATQKIITSQKEIVTIYQKRLAMGDAAIADIATQEATLAAAEATLPPLEQQLAVQRDLINALTGRFPDDRRTPKLRLGDIKLPTELPLSIPSCLLEHRPDIRAAEAQMHAANALIGVAIANRIPNVTINMTNAGTAATGLGSLFQQSTQFWALAGIIAQPLFDGGRLLHKQRFAEESYKAVAAVYRSTIINAFQNVADTLKAIKFDAIALKAHEKATRAALRSLSISRQQLLLGDSSELAILQNQQLYQQAVMNLIQAQANRLSDTAALYQALGGGWWNKPHPQIKPGTRKG